MAGYVGRRKVSTKSALCHSRAGKYHAGSSVLQVTATADKNLPSGSIKELQMAKTGKMTVPAASRIYAATATQGNGTVGKNTFGARAMSAAMRQAGQPVVANSGKTATCSSKQ